jgi:hypothetical protein
MVIVEHRPQLPFRVPHASAEGLVFALRHVRQWAAPKQRNRKN